MPSSFQNIKQISFKTVPSAAKVEIKRVLQNLYGFDVEEVRTLNMEGKKKKRGGNLIAKPDYKKAYVTLKTPLSLSNNLYPIRLIEEDKKNTAPKKSQSGVVEDRSAPSHWLDGEGNGDGEGIGRGRRFKKNEERPVKQGDGSAEKSKFPILLSWRDDVISGTKWYRKSGIYTQRQKDCGKRTIIYRQGSTRGKIGRWLKRWE